MHLFISDIQSQIIYIVDFRTMRVEDIGSDHHIVVNQIRLKVASIKMNTKNKQFINSLLTSHTVLPTLEARLSNEITKLPPEDNVT